MRIKHIHQPLILFLSILTIISLFTGALPTTAVAAPPVGPDKLADFEAGLPGNWFTFFGGSTVTTIPIVVGSSEALARPAQTSDNGLVQVDFNVFDFGGFGVEYATTSPGA